MKPPYIVREGSIAREGKREYSSNVTDGFETFHVRERRSNEVFSPTKEPHYFFCTTEEVVIDNPVNQVK